MSNLPSEMARRVLILAPTNRDGELTRSFLTEKGMACITCSTIQELIAEIDRGAGALLVTDELVNLANIDLLLAKLQVQPSWSDLPIVMLMRGGSQAPAASRVLDSMGNLTLLERPAPVRSVLSAVQAAVRGRDRQYQIRDQIEAINRARKEIFESGRREHAARLDAEHASAMKDEFLATLSHELRTPLNAIFGWVQLLKHGKNDPATIEQGIDVIDRNVRAQTQLIEDLLDMSRITSGKLRLDIQRVDLPAVISSAIDVVKPAAEAKRIEIQQMFDPKLSPVSGDPNRLQQVLWNLLTNAIKFTPKGGWVRVSAEHVESSIQVTVTDNGEGIAPAFLPRLFERFSQADGSMKRKHGGLGLGLSIVQSIVQLHGGTIWAKSEGAGKGSTFGFNLPVRATTAGDEQTPPIVSSSTAPDSIPTKLGGVKVLVIDDEPDARELVRRLLIDCEAIPALAASASEGHRLVNSFKPDVILSDIGMPGKDGYEFIRDVRKAGVKTPAIALTAFARAEDRIRSIQAGYQQHLPKPVEPAELIAVLASLSGRFSRERTEPAPAE